MSIKNKAVLFAILILVIALLSDCSHTSEPSGNVIVKKELSSITIRNKTGASIHYAVFERYSLALIKWAPVCRQTNEIPSFGVASVPVTDESFKPSDEAVVYWWQTCVKNPEYGFEVGNNLHTVVVRVR